MTLRRFLLACAVFGTTALGSTAIVALATRSKEKPTSDRQCRSQATLTNGCRDLLIERAGGVDALGERREGGRVVTQRRAAPANHLVTPAVVISVVDGDTARVRLGSGRQINVRLLGIDTPETKRPDTPVQCGGPQATEAMEARLKAGARIKLVGDPSQDAEDRYGRALAYVEKGGRDIGQEMVSAGLAKVYVFQADAPFGRVKAYRSAEGAARAEGRGNWQSCSVRR